MLRIPRRATLFSVAVLCACLGCKTIRGILPTDGPETMIRETPGKYGGVDSFYEESTLTVEEGGKTLEGVRMQVAVQHPGKLRLTVSGPEQILLVADGTSLGVQAAGEPKLSLQPMPDPLRFYHVAGLLERFKSSPYLAQSLVFPWVFRDLESQADLLLDSQQGVEVGTYWGEECVVYTYGDEAVKRLWRGREKAEGGVLRVWLHQVEGKVVREEWQVRLAESHRDVHLTVQHRNVRLDAVLEEERFAMEPLPLPSEAVAQRGATGTTAGSDAQNPGSVRATGAAPVSASPEETAALPEGPRGTALGALIRLLRHPTAEVATRAAALLHHHGRPEGMKCLTDWVGSQQPRWVAGAARAAAEVKENALKEGLLAQTAIPDGVARVWILRALYVLGDTRQLEVLEECLTAPDVNVQIEATQAITDVGGRAVLDALVANLQHSDADLRIWSAHALGELADGRAREALENGLANDADSGVRLHAALALRKIGDPRSREVLAKALVDSHKPVRLQAAGGLARLGDRNAFDFILGMLKSSHPDARREAILVLGALADPAAAESLCGFATSGPAPPDAELEEAAISLGKIGGEAAAAALGRLLSHDGEGVRLRAAIALFRQKHPAAVEALVRLTGSSDPEVALEAARALLQ